MNLYEEIDTYLQTHITVNIVIAGVTCSGKTTLTNAIQKYYSDKFVVAVVRQDDYFKNLSDIPSSKDGYLTDSLYAFHTDEFTNDIKQLLLDRVVFVPRYDVATNTRISKSKIVRSGTINIFEGLHTIHLLKELKNCITIFVDTELTTCLERRIARDTEKYGIPEVRIREYWNDCIIPMSERFILTQKKDADIIISCKDGEYNVN